MNYVISEEDLKDNGKKIQSLKNAANKNGIFFVCNTNFNGFSEEERKLANKYSNFGLEHSTFVDGRCQMGAGSSATVDYDGKLFRCPYMDGNGDGNFVQMSEEEREKVLRNYINDKDYSCVIRRILVNSGLK
jgi:hypothetical protein